MIITPGFPKGEADSYTIPFLGHLLPAFSERYPDVELTVVACQKPVSAQYFWNGIRVITLNGNDIRYPAKIRFLLKSYFRLRNIIKEEKFTGILNLWYNDFAVLSDFLPCNNFTWMLGQDVRASNRYLRIKKPKSQKLISISPFSDAVLEETAGIRAHKMIPIAVDPNLFPDLNTAERPIDIFGAGWLTPLKNYKLFLKVVLELQAQFPNIRAEIAGTGPEGESLQAFVKQHRLEPNIKFCGLISHEETLDKMNQSKIFLHTSTFEGGATVYAESLFSGCQLVGTLPLMDRPIKNFHCVDQKKAIAATIADLLKETPQAERIVYYPMEYVCDKIYKLYFQE